MVDSNPISLTEQLIAYPSVSPAGGEIFDMVQGWLTGLGFTCHRLPFGTGADETDNLYAELTLPAGEANDKAADNPPDNRAFHLAFCGHLDVVPAGNESLWQSPPFTPTHKDGKLIGRGAVDMKSAVAAWVSALAEFTSQFIGATEKSLKQPLTLSLILTGDEEDKAINGVRQIVPWLKTQGKNIDLCITGEPTSQQMVGDTLKIGRRGSFNSTLTIHGTQGHVAYPEKSANAAHALTASLHQLIGHDWDENIAPDNRNDFFPKTSLQITSIDIGNPTSNISPEQAQARFNIRFNPAHNIASLEADIRQVIEIVLANNIAGNPSNHPYEYSLDISASEGFYCAPNHLHQSLCDAVASVTGVQPEFSTQGGISDSRFLSNFCPVLDFGLCNAQMHQIDESVATEDILRLANIYYAIITRFAG